MNITSYCDAVFVFWGKNCVGGMARMILNKINLVKYYDHCIFPRNHNSCCMPLFVCNSYLYSSYVTIYSINTESFSAWLHCVENLEF